MTDHEFEQYRLHRESEGKLISAIAAHDNITLSDAIGVYLENPWMESVIFDTEIHAQSDIENLISQIIGNYSTG